MAEALKWYEKAGNCSDVVYSTRVRLARNLRQYPFPNRATVEQKQEIEAKIRDALISGNSAIASQFSFVPLEKLTDEEAVSLVERHIVSPEFISDRRNKALLLSEDESISIMINEEDHLRIQVMKEGLLLKEAAEAADRLDTLLGETLQFAFDPEFGYLTQCPTNLGTGMRASVMLHLPALTESGAMSRIAANLSKLGLTLRGSYGEGSQIVGGMYQLSNQITLGLSETEAIDNLGAIAAQLIEQERKTREEWASNIVLQDKIERAAGVLKSAKMLSSGEFMELLSYIRLGISVGLLKGVGMEELNELFVRMQPATLAASVQKPIDAGERDILRAEQTRKICANITEA